MAVRPPQEASILPHLKAELELLAQKDTPETMESLQKERFSWVRPEEGQDFSDSLIYVGRQLSNSFRKQLDEARAAGKTPAELERLFDDKAEWAYAFIDREKRLSTNLIVSERLARFHPTLQHLNREVNATATDPKSGAKVKVLKAVAYGERVPTEVVKRLHIQRHRPIAQQYDAADWVIGDWRAWHAAKALAERLVSVQVADGTIQRAPLQVQGVGHGVGDRQKAFRRTGGAKFDLELSSPTSTLRIPFEVTGSPRTEEQLKSYTARGTDEKVVPGIWVQTDKVAEAERMLAAGLPAPILAYAHNPPGYAPSVLFLRLDATTIAELKARPVGMQREGMKAERFFSLDFLSPRVFRGSTLADFTSRLALEFSAHPAPGVLARQAVVAERFAVPGTADYKTRIGQVFDAVQPLAVSRLELAWATRELMARAVAKEKTKPRAARSGVDR